MQKSAFGGPPSTAMRQLNVFNVEPNGLSIHAAVPIERPRTASGACISTD